MALSAAVATAAGAAGVGQAVAGMSPTHRQCSINITNKSNTYTLSNPRWYILSGSCAVPFPPTISSFTFGSAVFIKTPHTACGSVGAVTYDLLQNDSEQHCEKLGIMFSVPYDFNVFSNWYAVGIFDKYKECDYDLYYEMYYETNDSFIRGKADGPLLTYEGDRVTILATMSDAYQPVMKLEVSETD